MLNLTSYVGKLFMLGESESYLGSAFVLAPTSALTSTHCIADRETRTPFATSFKLQLPARTIISTLSRTDFAFDVALLTWQEPIDLPELPLDTLPELQSFEPDKLPFYGYGFPTLFPTGMLLTGTVSHPNGKVDEQRALEVLCNQGSAADLKGASGSPVCVGDRVVAVIRHGTGGGRVVFATHLADITKLSPELGRRLSKAAADEVADPLELYIALCFLARLSFQDVELRIRLTLKIAASQLLPDNVPTAERAQRLIDKCLEAGPQGIATLAKILAKEYPLVLHRARREGRTE